MSRVFRMVAVSMLVLALGLHWALLQTVAWTGMLITYAHDASFQEAVGMTFDGQHPCALCKVIKNGRAEERKHSQQQLPPSFKLELGLVWEATEFDFACVPDRIPARDLFGPSRSDQPPKPRPRGILPDNSACG